MSRMQVSPNPGCHTGLLIKLANHLLLHPGETVAQTSCPERLTFWGNTDQSKSLLLNPESGVIYDALNLKMK